MQSKRPKRDWILLKKICLWYDMNFICLKPTIKNAGVSINEFLEFDKNCQCWEILPNTNQACYLK